MTQPRAKLHDDCAGLVAGAPPSSRGYCEKAAVRPAGAVAVGADAEAVAMAADGAERRGTRDMPMVQRAVVYTSGPVGHGGSVPPVASSTSVGNRSMCSV